MRTFCNLQTHVFKKGNEVDRFDLITKLTSNSLSEREARRHNITILQIDADPELFSGELIFGDIDIFAQFVALMAEELDVYNDPPSNGCIAVFSDDDPETERDEAILYGLVDIEDNGRIMITTKITNSQMVIRCPVDLAPVWSNYPPNIQYFMNPFVDET